jgi:hypothetical protein
MGTYGGNQPQEGDVYLYQTLNDGDIIVEGGVVQMTGGFDTMAYLVLFGGNADDKGAEEKSKQWWANWIEPDESKHERGEFQYLIDSLPASSGNLLILEQAAQRDMDKAFVKTGIANVVTVTLSIPKINQVAVSIVIEADGDRVEFKFLANWAAMEREAS